MPKMFKLSLILTLVFAAQSYADSVGLVDGSTYFIAPGAGTVKGFQLSGGPFNDSVANNDSELIGPDISGSGLIVSTDTLVNNGNGNYDLILRVETTVGGNIMPTGIIGDSDVELTTLGLFVGGGLNPVDLASPIFANTANIEVFDTDNLSIGMIDVIGLGNFTTGIDGGWDGSLGLNFGQQIPIGDVGAIELQINFDAVGIPEPASASMLALSAACIAVRRRR